MCVRKFVLAGILAVACGLSCGCTGLGRGKDAAVKYEVTRVDQPIKIDANWDKPAWQKIKPLDVARYMGEKPAHLPKVQAKLAYDAENIYVIFRVDDNYVRAVARKNQDFVCRDSCVEFFFAPGVDVTKGYYNLETNCGGTMLLHFQTLPRQNNRPLAPELLDKIEIAHTQPRIVDPEIAQPTVWTLEYRLPVAVALTELPDAARPAPGVEWRANFFKCADRTSHPHWLTWAKVERPKPDFHVPEYFGTLVFK